MLVHAFVVNAASPWPITGNSNTQLPVWSTGVAATGGRHRGSLLQLGAADERRLDWRWRSSATAVPADIVAQVLAGDGMVSPVSAAFVHRASATFAARTLPAWGRGARPEPAAAGPGADFPPCCCHLLGYVGGFSVAFAFACSPRC